MPDFLLNFNNLSRNAVFILENQFFDEDLTVTKREKVHIFAHASWGQNDPLDGLDYNQQSLDDLRLARRQV